MIKHLEGAPYLTKLWPPTVKFEYFYLRGLRRNGKGATETPKPSNPKPARNHVCIQARLKPLNRPTHHLFTNSTLSATSRNSKP